MEFNRYRDVNNSTTVMRSMAVIVFLLASCQITHSIGTTGGTSPPPTSRDDLKTKPAWCEKSPHSIASASIPGSTAFLGANNARYTLVVQGTLSCPSMAQLSRDLFSQLSRCANGQSDECGSPISAASLDELRAAIQPNPIRIVYVAGVPVEVSLGNKVAIAQWSLNTSPSELLSKFEFPNQTAPTMTRAHTRSGPIVSGVSSAADVSGEGVSTINGFNGCLSVPCLPNQCSGNDGPDRDRFAIPVFAFSCQCPANPDCTKPMTEDECTCVTECCHSDAG